jgi:hypothetical protein
MFGETPARKLEKIIKKALKIVNKEFYNDKHTLGRYIIRDCFHLIKQTKEQGLLLSYCFECVDKATLFRKFYGFSSSVFENDVTLEKFIKQLRSLLNNFSTEPVPEHLNKPIEQKDFRHINID